MPTQKPINNAKVIFVTKNKNFATVFVVKRFQELSINKFVA